ncbi:cryptochrome/photolyase family protein [Paramagnetospirillum marisnigri]|nr:deoxyribodipyrimidine photo-lyase [Paramagnetospirillum marisnigri]
MMPPSDAPILVWFRRDLRLDDNPALAEAAATGRPVLPVYVHDEDSAGAWAEGGASRWWLHHSLARLGEGLKRLGVPLLLRRGPAAEMLAETARMVGADTVVWNRRIEPWAARQEAAVAARAAGAGLVARAVGSPLLFEPDRVTSKLGTPLKVFTPFWRACLAAPPPTRPIPAPERLIPCATAPAGDALEHWRLLPKTPDWAGGLRDTWRPGEADAARRLSRFLAERLDSYAGDRDRPAVDGTSGLSPHLHFGEISPRRVFHAAFDAPPSAGHDRFLAELGWREFSAHLLMRSPDMDRAPLNTDFARMDWRSDPEGLEAWRRGRTGYPLVDAGMRQLWQTGWMHNRVRMVVASFLVKDLLLPWTDGAAWFWDTLVDADLASNSASWQWVAGCGADAAPFFRVFNPALQGEKFDSDGGYVRRWCPELARLPDRWLHQPWRAPSQALAMAGIALGRDYPRPVVDHDLARKRALDAFSRLRQ